MPVGRCRAITITSINHNPNNDSKYARRRSIWKGNRNQLKTTVAALNGTTGIKVYEYLASWLPLQGMVTDAWHFRMHAQRTIPKGFQPLGKWHADPPSGRALAAAGGLRGDLQTLWRDFITVTGRRVGGSEGPGSDLEHRYSGESLVLFAFGPQSFDIIVSKYGYGENLKLNHHFNQWQARGNAFQGLVNVDDYESEEGLTLYVVA